MESMHSGSPRPLENPSRCLHCNTLQHARATKKKASLPFVSKRSVGKTLKVRCLPEGVWSFYNLLYMLQSFNVFHILWFCLIKFHFKFLHRCQGKNLPPVLPVCSSLFESWQRCGDEGMKSDRKTAGTIKTHIAQREAHSTSQDLQFWKWTNKQWPNMIQLHLITLYFAMFALASGTSWPLPHLCPLGALKHRPALPGSAQDTVRNTVRDCRNTWTNCLKHWCFWSPGMSCPRSCGTSRFAASINTGPPFTSNKTSAPGNSVSIATRVGELKVASDSHKVTH